MTSFYSRWCVVAMTIALLGAREAWALSATIEFPAAGSVRTTTSTVSGSGNVTVMQYEDISNYTAELGFGTIQNGVFVPENSAPVTLTATSWAKILSPPSSGVWNQGMMDHVAKLTIKDGGGSTVATAQTNNHTVM